MQFVWDPVNERRNVEKHGLDFSYAQRIFADPRVLVAPDRIVDQEERWHAIGLVDAHRYDDLDSARVWSVIQEHIPSLRTNLIALLDKVTGDE